MHNYDIYIDKDFERNGADFLLRWVDYFYFSENIIYSRKKMIFHVKKRINPVLFPMGEKEREKLLSINSKKIYYSREEVYYILLLSIKGYMEFKFMVADSGCYLSSTSVIRKFHVCLNYFFYFREIFSYKDGCSVFYSRDENSLLSPSNYYKPIVW